MDKPLFTISEHPTIVLTRDRPDHKAISSPRKGAENSTADAPFENPSTPVSRFVRLIADESLCALIGSKSKKSETPRGLLIRTCCWRSLIDACAARVESFDGLTAFV